MFEEQIAKFLLSGERQQREAWAGKGSFSSWKSKSEDLAQLLCCGSGFCNWPHIAEEGN
jgi:hypothetical protein